MDALSEAQRQALAHYFGGNTVLFAAYKAACDAQFAHDCLEGDSALAATDFAGLHRLAHSLKTVLQTLGHEDGCVLASRLDRLCVAMPVDAEATQQEWLALRHHLQR